MTKILLNSRGFVTEVIFSHILPFSDRGKKFSRRRMTKFWLGEKNFPWQNALSDEIFPEKVIAFPKSAVTASKILTVINFYGKIFKRLSEKRFHVYRGFSLHWSNYILSTFWKLLKQERWFENYPDRWKFIPANIL